MSNTNQLEMMERIALDLERVGRALASSFNTGAEDFNDLIRPLSEAGGKRLRAQLCLLIANAGQSIETERIKIAEAVEMLHLATLIHDDVLDQAEIRRGEDTIHKHKGNKVAILSGDYLFAKAFRIVSEMPHMEYLKVFSHIISCLVEGEFMQMEDVYRIDQGIDRYMIKTQKKTADFMEGCMELGGLLGGWSSVGNDLREGLLTYPLLSIVNETNKDQLLEDIQNLNHGGNEQDIIDYVIARGGIDNTLRVAQQYCDDALSALQAIRDFEGKEFLVLAVQNLADRKV